MALARATPPETAVSTFGSYVCSECLHDRPVLSSLARRDEQVCLLVLVHRQCLCSSWFGICPWQLEMLTCAVSAMQWPPPVATLTRVLARSAPRALTLPASISYPCVSHAVMVSPRLLKAAQQNPPVTVLCLATSILAQTQPQNAIWTPTIQQKALPAHAHRAPSVSGHAGWCFPGHAGWCLSCFVLVVATLLCRAAPVRVWLVCSCLNILPTVTCTCPASHPCPPCDPPLLVS